MSLPTSFSRATSPYTIPEVFRSVSLPGRPKEIYRIKRCSNVCVGAFCEESSKILDAEGPGNQGSLYKTARALQKITSHQCMRLISLGDCSTKSKSIGTNKKLEELPTVQADAECHLRSGWEQRVDHLGDTYYLDQNTRMTTGTRPSSTHEATDHPSNTFPGAAGGFSFLDPNSPGAGLLATACPRTKGGSMCRETLEILRNTSTVHTIHPRERHAPNDDECTTANRGLLLCRKGSLCIRL